MAQPTRAKDYEDKMRINELTIKQLPFSDKGQQRFRDDGLPGFGVLVGKRSKTFFVVHGRDRRTETLGRWPEVSVKEARLAAASVMSDPTPRKRHTSLPEARDAFLVDCSRRLRPSTASRYYYALKDIDLTDTSITDPTTLKCLKAFHNWCIQQGVSERNPFAHRKVRFEARDRLLSDDEVTAIWAYEHPPYSDIVKLLILTGQRRKQIWQYRTDWREGDAITFPSSIMKSNRAHALPVTGYEKFLPHQPFEFNSWSKAKQRMDKFTGITDYVLHDFRRYFSSTMARLGVPLHVTEQIIDHRSQLTDVAAIYNRYDYLAEMREALTAYEAHITQITGNTV